MATIRQRNDPVRLLWRRLALVMLFILMIAAAWTVWGVYKKEHESRILRNEAQMQLQDLMARQARLATDVEALETERGKEEALRSAYEVGKYGEGLIVIVDDTPTTTRHATSSPLDWFKRAFSWW
ncbi:hypothetical protein HY968_02965 [Candidatus Kaiserbacteria bacterium]|nr:hypothetical protein [Candidatus Kaiserbacteria bacterium]